MKDEINIRVKKWPFCPRHIGTMLGAVMFSTKRVQDDLAPLVILGNRILFLDFPCSEGISHNIDSIRETVK